VQGYRRLGRIDHCQAAPDVAVLVGRRQEQQDPQRRIVEYIAEQVLDPLGLLGAGPQPVHERVDAHARRVALTGEPAVHEILHAPAQRPERHRRDQSAARHGPGRLAAEHRAKHDRGSAVGGGEEDRQGEVDDSAVDDQVNIEEPVPQDRSTQAQRGDDQNYRGQRPDERRTVPERDAHRNQDHDVESDQGDPLELQPLHRAGRAIAHDKRAGRADQRQRHQCAADGGHDVPLRAGHGVRVRSGHIVAAGSGIKHVPGYEQRGACAAGVGDDRPPWPR